MVSFEKCAHVFAIIAFNRIKSVSLTTCNRKIANHRLRHQLHARVPVRATRALSRAGLCSLVRPPPRPARAMGPPLMNHESRIKNLRVSRSSTSTLLPPVLLRAWSGTAWTRTSFACGWAWRTRRSSCCASSTRWSKLSAACRSALRTCKRGPVCKLYKRNRASRRSKTSRSIDFKIDWSRACTWKKEVDSERGTSGVTWLNRHNLASSQERSS